MKAALVLTSCATVLAGGIGAVCADPWKDESGKGRWRGDYRDFDRRHYAREYREEFRYNGCKIERKWERDGSYKEEIKCDGRRR